MDAFDCFIKTGSPFNNLPQDIFKIIRDTYIRLLEEETNKIILESKRNMLYQILKENIIQSGHDYSYLSKRRYSGDLSIPESYNIVKCVLQGKWLELDMLPPYVYFLRSEYPVLSTPNWLLQLKERLHLKYKTQFVHCLSQLKRFVGYFKTGDLSRTLQFGYNLGLSKQK